MCPKSPAAERALVGRRKVKDSSARNAQEDGRDGYNKTSGSEAQQGDRGRIGREEA